MPLLPGSEPFWVGRVTEATLRPTKLKEQTRQALKNIDLILQSSHSSLDCVIKSTIFLTNLGDFPLVNDVYQKFFEKPFPARSTVQVSKLPLEAKVEIEVIAAIKK